MKQHIFNVEEAEKYGIEKAVLLYNLRFWLNKEHVNAKNGKGKVFKHSDGKSYAWMFNSAKEFAELFPYLNPRSISRWLKELEEENKVIISNNFNRSKYDKTKWYSMSEYSISQNDESKRKQGKSAGKTGSPIPDVITDVISNVNPSMGENKFSQGDFSLINYLEWAEEKAKSSELSIDESIPLFGLLGESVDYKSFYSNKHERNEIGWILENKGSLALIERLKFHAKANKLKISKKAYKSSQVKDLWQYIDDQKDILLCEIAKLPETEEERTARLEKEKQQKIKNEETRKRFEMKLNELHRQEELEKERELEEIKKNKLNL
jgi:hypothetical protein